jgi:hypothetical protein
VIHIEIHAVILVFYTAGLIVDFLGEKICTLFGNRRNAYGSGIGDQVNPSLLVNTNLLGIVREAAKGFFCRCSQYIRCDLLFHNNLNTDVIGDKLAGFVQQVRVG